MMEIVEDNNNKINHTDDDFTILFDKVKRNKSNVQEILPDWIINATKVDDAFENSMKLSKVSEISDEVKKVLRGSIKKFFPVQHAVIPAILKSNRTIGVFRPHDICVCAPTGSGKTLAYVTPILQLLKKDITTANGPRALVVLPVRDLALQVYNAFNGLSKSLGIRCALITGQKNLNDEKKDLLDERDCNKVDIVICTPGRLVDHLRNSKGVEWTHLRYLVIDEADRILEEHKHDWYLTLSKTIEASRQVNNQKKYKNIMSCFIDNDGYFLQKILLSATLTREPHLLEHFDLHYPILYVVGGSKTATTENDTWQAKDTDISDNYAAPKGLHDFFVVYNKEYSRILFIVDQIRAKKRTKILCFTNTRDSAIRLSQLLKEFKGVRCEYLSCQLHPKTRRKLLHTFEQGGLDILVTVDSMGRGMDIEGVQCVIQYDVAHDVHTHIHRVGRTARAGQEGYAFALCSEKQVYHLKSEVSSCNRVIKQQKFQINRCYKYMSEYNQALSNLQNGGRCEDAVSSMNVDQDASSMQVDKDESSINV